MSPGELIHRERPAAGKAEGLLVLMHGRGVDENDLLPLADLFDPERRLAAYAPRGPLRLPGQPGSHWYVVERVGFPEPESFGATHELLGGWLEGRQAEAGIAPERTVLAGFSQGTVMAYALGLGAGRPRPAGILALSGFIPTVQGWEPDLAARGGLPVYLAHGVRDPVITIGFARRARERLDGTVDLTYREHPGGHSIDPRTFDEMREWLAGVIPPGPQRRVST